MTSLSWKCFPAFMILEQVPEELVVNLMVVLHFRRFHECPKRARAAVRGSAFQVRETSLYIGAQQLGCPPRLFKVFERRIDVVRQIALRLAQVLDFRGFAVQT